MVQVQQFEWVAPNGVAVFACKPFLGTTPAVQYVVWAWAKWAKLVFAEWKGQK